MHEDILQEIVNNDVNIAHMYAKIRQGIVYRTAHQNVYMRLDVHVHWYSYVGAAVSKTEKWKESH